MHSADNSVASVVRQLLRDETHAEHVRLNQHPLLRGITRSDYSMAMYRLVLVAYHHFYRVVESAIDRSLSSLTISFSYEPRRKLQWIAEDLEKLGIDPQDSHFFTASPLASLPVLNVGQLVGLLYTVEGSSLGGQVISRHLATHHGLTPANGARFFYGYGERIPEFWREFERFMDTTLIDDEAISCATDSAKKTFAMMESILDGCHAQQAN
ncbi:MAG: biliverdin-producing heme oxygenase [Gammaproteobacteria bacterium]|nr:biliverdin-producing heme oxygenase [Gammaproteobacteria bacterium]MBU2434281.1 biliverdin-producing heme oxygenase [Gammaproteobacteria bacterium]